MCEFFRSSGFERLPCCIHGRDESSTVRVARTIVQRTSYVVNITPIELFTKVNSELESQVVPARLQIDILVKLHKTHIARDAWYSMWVVGFTLRNATHRAVVMTGGGSRRGMSVEDGRGWRFPWRGGG